MVQLTSLILPSIFTLAFSAKAAFTGPSGNGTFSLIALAYDGDLHLSGLFRKSSALLYPQLQLHT